MSKKIKELFKKFLELSDSLRNNYSNSLEINDDEELNGNGIPDVLSPIYSKVKGTLYEVKNQSLMDFIPGFLLIHKSEYREFKSKMTKMLSESKDSYFPFLVNYSSDFYALKVENRIDKGVFLINHDELNPIKIHDSFEAFFETIIAFYEKQVYFLDEDGYLDMDFDKEEEVAQELNPEIPFWFEE